MVCLRSFSRDALDLDLDRSSVCAIILKMTSWFYDVFIYYPIDGNVGDLDDIDILRDPIDRDQAR
jgi:hypothetical protein